MKKTDTRKIVGIALFTAIVVVLQFLGSFIRFGMFSISLVLIPIVVGAALYGVAAGAWLGFAFGLTVLISGDAALFLAVSPLGTILTVLVKGTAAGVCAGAIYRAISSKNITIGVAASAVVAPVANTGIFLVGCVLFFYETIAGWASAAGFGDRVAAYMFLGLAGGNFLVELAVNIILSPLIVRLIRIGSGKAHGNGARKSASI